MIKSVIDNQKEKWIVLIHPMGGTERIFEKQIPLLSEKYNIATIRLAGHTKDSSIDDASFETVTKEINKFAVEQKTKISLIGVSLGAMIATYYLINYPSSVDTAYLVSPAFGFSSRFMKFGYYLAFKIRKVIPKSLYMHMIVSFILNNKEEKMYRDNFYKFTLRMDKKILYKWLEEITLFLNDGVNKIEMLNNFGNVRLIYGEKDKLFLNFTRKYSSNIETVKDSGHLCNITNPDEFNKLLIR